LRAIAGILGDGKTKQWDRFLAQATGQPWKASLTLPAACTTVRWPGRPGLEPLTGGPRRHNRRPSWLSKLYSGERSLADSTPAAALTAALPGDVAPKNRPPVAGRKPAPLAIGALIRHLGWPARTGRHQGPEQREPQPRVPAGTPSAIIL